MCSVVIKASKIYLLSIFMNLFLYLFMKLRSKNPRFMVIYFFFRVQHGIFISKWFFLQLPNLGNHHYYFLMVLKKKNFFFIF